MMFNPFIECVGYLIQQSDIKLNDLLGLSGQLLEYGSQHLNISTNYDRCAEHKELITLSSYRQLFYDCEFCSKLESYCLGSCRYKCRSWSNVIGYVSNLDITSKDVRWHLLSHINRVAFLFSLQYNKTSKMYYKSVDTFRQIAGLLDNELPWELII